MFSSLPDLFDDCLVHAPFRHKLSSLLMHLCQKSLALLVDKRHAADHDSRGQLRASSVAPQSLSSSTHAPVSLPSSSKMIVLATVRMVIFNTA